MPRPSRRDLLKTAGAAGGLALALPHDWTVDLPFERFGPPGSAAAALPFLGTPA